MTHDLTGKTIAFIVATEGIEQVELTEPWKAVQEAGGTPKLFAPRRGGAGLQPPRQGRHVPGRRGRRGRPVDDYDALVLPGGVANPDALRTHDDAVAFAKAFFDAASPSPRSATRPGPGRGGVVKGRS